MSEGRPRATPPKLAQHELMLPREAPRGASRPPGPRCYAHAHSRSKHSQSTFAAAPVGRAPTDTSHPRVDVSGGLASWPHLGVSRCVDRVCGGTGGGEHGPGVGVKEPPGERRVTSRDTAETCAGESIPVHKAVEKQR